MNMNNFETQEYARLTLNRYGANERVVDLYEDDELFTNAVHDFCPDHVPEVIKKMTVGEFICYADPRNGEIAIHELIVECKKDDGGSVRAYPFMMAFDRDDAHEKAINVLRHVCSEDRIVIDEQTIKVEHISSTPLNEMNPDQAYLVIDQSLSDHLGKVMSFAGNNKDRMPIMISIINENLMKNRLTNRKSPPM